MKIRITVLGCALLAAGVAACTRAELQHEFDPGVDFSGYRTFAWITPREGAFTQARRPQVDSAIRGAVEEALMEKGFRKAEGDEADLLVAYHAGLDRVMDTQNLNTYYGDPWVIGTRWSETSYVRQYQEGTLVIDISDRRESRLIWRGAAQARLRGDETVQEIEKKAREVARDILKPFPPR